MLPKQPPVRGASTVAGGAGGWGCFAGHRATGSNDGIHISLRKAGEGQTQGWLKCVDIGCRQWLISAGGAVGELGFICWLKQMVPHIRRRHRAMSSGHVCRHASVWSDTNVKVFNISSRVQGHFGDCVFHTLDLTMGLACNIMRACSHWHGNNVGNNKLPGSRCTNVHLVVSACCDVDLAA